jgi:hypothetical protein
MKRGAWIVGAVAMGLSAACDAGSVTLESLLDEMTDRDAIARTPSPAYSCRQFSSYDRRADCPTNPATWYANGDQRQFLRIDEVGGRKEAVMMDAEGPGAIVRWWCTWKDPQGTLRIYIDDAPEPVVEGNDGAVISGGSLAGPPLSAERSRGHNLYLPIPYARRCRVTWEGPDKGPFYYQINYRSYAPGTQVESFSKAGLAAAGAKIAAVCAALTNTAGTVGGEPAGSLEGPLAPGAMREVAVDGAGSVRGMTLKLAAADMDQALRSTVIEIVSDGERTVWAPVGAFFGVGHSLRPYEGWYSDAAEDGTLTCRWVMPYARSAVVRLRNLGTAPVEVTVGRVTKGAWAWDDRSMHFHATWRQHADLMTQTNAGADHGAFDVNYVEVKGAGVYAGDSLTVDNSVRAWWGEGDEKIFVDGEAFPSHFGTGTEDYYGYAWCFPAPFSAPFHAQPTGEGNSKPGMSVNSRWRSLDAIPFTKALKVDMELWHWKKTRVHYAPATFWYARPGATCNVEPAPGEAARAVASVPQPPEGAEPAFKIAGAIEGESLRIVECTGGQTRTQEWAHPIWSRDTQLWWTHGKPGDRLVLEVPVAKAGRYRIEANCTLAVDYGVMKIAINGQVLRERLDFYNDGVIARMIDLGVADLPAGTVKIEVTIVGANPAAKPAHMFGLDCLKLAPAP